MDLWQIIAAVYLSGVLAAMYSIWWPSYKLVRTLAPTNIMIQKPLLSTFIVFIGLGLVAIPTGIVASSLTKALMKSKD